MLDINDVLALPDLKSKKNKKSDNKVIILLGNKKNNISDQLISGRRILENAKKSKHTYWPVRLAFRRQNFWFDLITPFIRVLRKNFIKQGSNIYHMDPFEIRKMGLERAHRTPENAYILTSKQWKMSDEERLRRYNELKKSFEKNGFDDKYPIEILLHRNFGTFDSLNQGHHRMMMALDLKLPRVAVRFDYATHTTNRLQRFFKSVKKRWDKFC